jgi:hypothetical protein
MGEFLNLFFQPPVLILFVLAVVGLSDLLSRRSDYRFRVDMEWRVRESWMRGWMKRDDSEFIERARRQFYERKMMKLPKRVVKGKSND